jgi:hypothetical protein
VNRAVSAAGENRVHTAANRLANLISGALRPKRLSGVGLDSGIAQGLQRRLDVRAPPRAFAAG